MAHKQGLQSRRPLAVTIGGIIHDMKACPPSIFDDCHGKAETGSQEP